MRWPWDTYAAPRLNRRFGVSACGHWWQAVFSLAAGHGGDLATFPVLRDLYAQLIGTASPKNSACFDPLCAWFPALPSSRPDFGFTGAALRYLQNEGCNDALFARVFWQTVRGRVLFYRHIVQRPMVPGLQWFIRTYGRLSQPRKTIPDRDFVPQAAKLAGEGLRALEVRVTSSDRVHDLVKLINAVDKEAKVLPTRPEVGVVFHFSRTRGEAAEAGRPAAWSRGCNGDPAETRLNPSGYRYSGYYRKERIGALALANLLTAYPRMLERVRGIDLCTDELGVPLWVMLSLLEHVRHAANQATAYLQQLEGQSPKPFGITIHAGEGFVHLMGGIRRVDESIELCQLGEGSRIGHAVALGTHVEQWAAQSGRLALPKGERLLDLLWAWRVANHAPDMLRSWLPWIDQELVRLGSELFKHPLTAARLNDWWNCLHNRTCLRTVGFPDGPRYDKGSEPMDPLDMVYRWLTDRAVFRRAQVLEFIEVEREVDLVTALQGYVRTKVRERGIIIEINPSSNLLIGNLGDLATHPLWRLSPPNGFANGVPGVRVCIGSDDPITFATRLPEEYQLLADVLTEAGIAGSDVDAWLEAARQCSLLTRFTVPRSDKGLTSLMCSKILPSPL